MHFSRLCPAQLAAQAPPERVLANLSHRNLINALMHSVGFLEKVDRYLVRWITVSTNLLILDVYTRSP